MFGLSEKERMMPGYSVGHPFFACWRCRGMFAGTVVVPIRTPRLVSWYCRGGASSLCNIWGLPQCHQQAPRSPRSPSSRMNREQRDPLLHPATWIGEGRDTSMARLLHTISVSTCSTSITSFSLPLACAAIQARAQPRRWAG